MKNSRRFVALLTTILMVLCSISPVLANPIYQGAGSQGVDFSGPNGSEVASVTMNGNRAFVNWDTFDSTAGQTFTIVSNPFGAGASSILNRVASGPASTIAGNIVAVGNINVFIVNPNGVNTTGNITTSGSVNISSRDVISTSAFLVADPTTYLAGTGTPLSLGGTITAGSANFIAAGGITQSAPLIYVGTGASNFSTNATGKTIMLPTQTNSFGGPVAFKAVATNLGAGIPTVNAQLYNSAAAGTAINNSIVTGNIYVQSTGPVTQNAAISANGLGVFTYGNAAHISLLDAANDALWVRLYTPAVGTGVTVAGNASFVNSHSTGTVFTASNVGGLLSVTSSAGSITQQQAIQALGGVSLSTPVNITMNLANSFTGGPVTLTTFNGSGSLTNTNSAGTILGNMGIKRVGLTGGDLTINSTGPVTQFSNLLNDAAAHDVTITSQGAVTLGNGAGSTNFRNNLTVNAAGAVNQAGAIVVPGISSFTTTGDYTNITLTDTGNSFVGAVGFNTGLTGRAQAYNINPASGMILGASNVGLGGLYIVNGRGGVTQTGAINTTGVLGVQDTDSGAYAINLNNGTQHNNIAAARFYTAGGLSSATLDNTLATDGLVMGATNVAGTMTINTAGTLRQDTSPTIYGGTTVGGTASLTADNVNMNNTANAFTGAVTSNTTGYTTLTNSIATALGASTVGGNYTVLSTGAITQPGAVSVGGNASLTSSASTLAIGVLTVTGDTSLKARGNITQTGALTTNKLNGETTITPATITLTNVGNKISGSIGFITDDKDATTGTATVVNSTTTDTMLGASDCGLLTVTSTNSGISQTEAFTSKGKASLTTTSILAGKGNINLTNSANSIYKPISFNTAANNGTVTLNNSNSTGTQLWNVSTGNGALTIVSNGSISSVGALTSAAAATYDLTTTNTSSNILLDNASNALSGVIKIHTDDTIPTNLLSRASISNTVDTRLGESTVGYGGLILSIVPTGATTPDFTTVSGQSVVINGPITGHVVGTTTLNNLANATNIGAFDADDGLTVTSSAININGAITSNKTVKLWNGATGSSNITFAVTTSPTAMATAVGTIHSLAAAGYNKASIIIDGGESGTVTGLGGAYTFTPVGGSATTQTMLISSQVWNTNPGTIADITFVNPWIAIYKNANHVNLANGTNDSSWDNIQSGAAFTHANFLAYIDGSYSNYNSGSSAYYNLNGFQ